MSLGRVLVAPDLHDRKPARPRDLLEHLEGETAVLLAARLGILPGSGGGLRRLGRVNLKIDHGIEWTVHGFLRIDRPHQSEHKRGHKKDRVCKTHLQRSSHFYAGASRKRQSLSRVIWLTRSTSQARYSRM